MRTVACKELAGLRNLLFIRCSPSILRRTTIHGFRRFHSSCTYSATENIGDIESTTRNSIKEKFVMAALSIDYHFPERSPDPTDAQLDILQEKLRYIL